MATRLCTGPRPRSRRRHCPIKTIAGRGCNVFLCMCCACVRSSARPILISGTIQTLCHDQQPQQGAKQKRRNQLNHPFFLACGPPLVYIRVVRLFLFVVSLLQTVASLSLTDGRTRASPKERNKVGRPKGQWPLGVPIAGLCAGWSLSMRCLDAGPSGRVGAWKEKKGLLADLCVGHPQQRRASERTKKEFAPRRRRRA
nr:hypothetical protein [Pandoravirus massiliensis]